MSGIPVWPSRDPIGEFGGVNLYGFIRNDGVNLIDLLGWSDCKCTADVSINNEGLDEAVNITEISTLLLELSRDMKAVTGIPANVKGHLDMLNGGLVDFLMGKIDDKVKSPDDTDSLVDEHLEKLNEMLIIIEEARQEVEGGEFYLSITATKCCSSDCDGDRRTISFEARQRKGVNSRSDNRGKWALAST